MAGLWYRCVPSKSEFCRYISARWCDTPWQSLPHNPTHCVSTNIVQSGTGVRLPSMCEAWLTNLFLGHPCLFDIRVAHVPDSAVFVRAEAD